MSQADNESLLMELAARRVAMGAALIVLGPDNLDSRQSGQVTAVRSILAQDWVPVTIAEAVSPDPQDFVTVEQYKAAQARHQEAAGPPWTEIHETSHPDDYELPADQSRRGTLHLPPPRVLWDGYAKPGRWRVVLRFSTWDDDMRPGLPIVMTERYNYLDALGADRWVEVTDVPVEVVTAAILAMADYPKPIWTRADDEDDVPPE